MVPVPSKTTRKKCFEKSGMYRGTYVIQISQLPISEKCSNIKILVADNRFQDPSVSATIAQISIVGLSKVPKACCDVVSYVVL